eukprot:9495956-Pyramimonas_sp.AAC.1
MRSSPRSSPTAWSNSGARSRQEWRRGRTWSGSCRWRSTSGRAANTEGRQGASPRPGPPRLPHVGNAPELAVWVRRRHSFARALESKSETWPPQLPQAGNAPELAVWVRRH